MARSNVWMSVSDLMTGLMIIFLFVAVSYMVKVQDNQSVLTNYVDTKKNLHEKLVSEFAGDTARWQMSIGKDLTMKFENPTVLFASGEWELTDPFKDILEEFLPRYFNILLKDTLRDRIQEIRIEGHTDDVPIPKLDQDPYIANIILSQRRALSVVKYFRDLPVFQEYNEEEQRLIKYWLTANGFSYGKSLDENGEYTMLSGSPINRELSRRVEIRVVTSGDEILESFVEKNEKGLLK
ncbi:MAG: OmpA family protein [Bacteroidales bacterium]|nr:OmpA family protein [Bacteroidales bacterium]